MDQVELDIYRVHGLTDKTDNRGSFWIKFDLGYSKDDKIGVCVCVCSSFTSTLLSGWPMQRRQPVAGKKVRAHRSGGPEFEKRPKPKIQYGRENVSGTSRESL